MAVEVGEVEMVPRDESREQQRSAPGPGSESGAPDPKLAIQIDHTIAALRSRDLRLRAD
jgi:hypothetical protein